MWRYFLMKVFIAVLVVIGLLAGIGIGQAEMISAKLETYADTKTQEPKTEDLTVKNIAYTYYTAKYDRCLVLVEKFLTLDKYQSSPNKEFVMYMRAKCFDRKLFNREAFVYYEEYSKEYPEGKYKKDVTWRMTDLRASSGTTNQ